MPETRIAKAGRIAARITTIVVVIAAVAIKLSVDKAIAEFEEAQLER